VHTYELALISATPAAARKVWRRRQPNFGRCGSARQPDLVRASRKTDGGAAEGSRQECTAVGRMLVPLSCASVLQVAKILDLLLGALLNIEICEDM